jgi:S-adenosylmethionine-diacylglycerol 3-amino-3-carboxypropyl transferase
MLSQLEKDHAGMIHTTNNKEKLNTRIFKAVHSRNLVYNTCWEDPALDRVALDLGPEDRLVVITSAGCNALDYLLAGTGEVNAVDVNPIQNSLLEFKKVCIEHLDHKSFFELFGLGRSRYARQMYQDVLRQQLSPVARTYWDRHIHLFLGRGWRKSFYYRGTSGLFAKLALLNAQVLQRLRRPIARLLEAQTIDEQRDIYLSQIRKRIWTPWLKWFLSRTLTLSLLGVPWPQRDQITNQYPGGITQFIRDALESVLLELPFRDNYFWRVYLQGHYTLECCPEYLKPANFARLKALLPRLHIHTSTMTDFLRRTKPGLSRFVLLDHMDWMAFNHPQGLVDEWNAILDKSRPNARAIFRSAGLKVDYLDHLKVHYRGRPTELGELLRYNPDLTDRLHKMDRVHTYGCFSVADLPG